MSSGYRRFEILLPLRFNDGTDVPDSLVGETLAELRLRFGAVSWETQEIKGQWEHAGEIYLDDLVRVFADVPDEPESREFFVAFKSTLKQRFKQIEIWMTSYPLDVI